MIIADSIPDIPLSGGSCFLGACSMQCNRLIERTGLVGSGCGVVGCVYLDLGPWPAVEDQCASSKLDCILFNQITFK